MRSLRSLFWAVLRSLWWIDNGSSLSLIRRLSSRTSGRLELWSSKFGGLGSLLGCNGLSIIERIHVRTEFMTGKHAKLMHLNGSKNCSSVFPVVLKGIWRERVLVRNVATWSQGFPRRLTSGGIFNSRLLFSLLFSENFCGGTRPWWRGTKPWWGVPTSPSARENPASGSKIYNRF